MIKLFLLLITSIILLVVFIILLIYSFLKKTRKSTTLAIVSFLLLLCTGIYTLNFGLEKSKEKAVQLAEKIFPSFDSDEPDTKANKKNFRAFLKVELTPDVKNIYCFDDAIGQDADYMFSFNCDSITAKRIIERNEFVADKQLGNYSEGLQNDFFWWDKPRIEKLPSYSWQSNFEAKKNVYKTFWYDNENNKAYYFEYDL